MRTFVNGSRFNSRAGRVTPVMGIRNTGGGAGGRNAARGAGGRTSGS